MKKLLLLPLILSVLFISYTKADYSRDYKRSYSRAFNKWITTQPTIDKANMYWNITRIELAKMVSNYAVNVLKEKVNTNIYGCKFEDINDELNKKYDNWVTNACFLGLMWQKISKFRPYDKVTVAEAWTIISRLINWHSILDYDNPYYVWHLNSLYYNWILSDISNPTSRNAIRGDVMSMLRRSEVWGDINLITKAYKADGYKLLYASNLKDKQLIKWDKVLYINDKYGYVIDLWEDMIWWYLEHSNEYRFFESYNAYLSEDDEPIQSKNHVFSWEELINFYNKDWGRVIILTVSKISDVKFPGYCNYKNNKYCISIGCDAGIDTTLVYRAINMYEI